MSDSEDSDESDGSNDCIVVKEVKQKPKPKPPKETPKETPNVMQYKSHFIPGKAFEASGSTAKSQTYVRKRSQYLSDKNNGLGSRESVPSVDDYDSDETIIDAEFAEIPDDWRNGPAKLWYDRLGLSPDCQKYDYGFKLKPKAGDSPPVHRTEDTEDSYHLVSQICWEKNVIWDPDVVRQKIEKSLGKPSIAGWIPIEEKRTAPQFLHQKSDKIIGSDNNTNNVINECNNDLKCDNKTKNKTKINGTSKTLRKRKASQSSVEAVSLPKRTPQSPKPLWMSTLYEENRELQLNLWEEDIIWDPEAMTRIPEPKIIPFSGDDDNAIIDWSNDFDENSNDSNDQMVNNLRQLSLNISNDEFYASVTRVDKCTTDTLVITHSNPASNLHPLCFPTWDQDFFRPLLKRTRRLAPNVEHNVFLCDNKSGSDSTVTQTTSTKDLSQFLIKNIGELTARNGQIVLMEYSEESPPLVMRVGMGSQLLNYFNKTKDKNYCPETHRFAQTKPVSNSPFIGDIGSGRSQLALETNMFRSPIWEHSCPETDFLVIRTENSYHIREVDGLFVVGQQLPLMEVPKLKSKTNYDFAKQFAKMFIYRYFDGRKSVKNLDKELQNAFPNLNKNLLNTILKKFTIKQSDRYLLMSGINWDFQINHLLTPENCCAYYSTAITAATTLKELGEGDRLYLNDEDIDNDNRLDSLAIAPWNTSVAYIGTLNSRKWLNVNDYNEDGSLVFRTQSYKDFKDQMHAIKRCVALTNRSIKRLTLPRAHQWLINYGMARDRVKKYRNLGECQELITDLCQDLRESGVTPGMSRMRTTEQYYRLQCQKVFDLHSRVYSKHDYETDESDDEPEEEESDSELELMGQDLEAMLMENKSLEQIEFEREEEIRKNWLREEKGEKTTENKTKRSFKGKVLKIYRTYEMNGKSFVRQEIVRIPKVIEAYVRIRETKSEDFIRQLNSVKNVTESNVTNAKKRSNKQPVNGVIKTRVPPKKINGVLKTVTQNVSNIRNGFVTNNTKDIEDFDVNDDNWDIVPQSEGQPSEVLPTEESGEGLVLVSGLNIKFGKKVILDANRIEAEEQRKIQEEMEEEEKWKRIDYCTPRTVNRMRIDPMVRLKDIFDNVILEVRKMKELDESIDWFMEPIKRREVPDYYDIITNPMDLGTIRSKCNARCYSNSEEFLNDVKLIHENSLEYNGDNEITDGALKLFQFCKQKLDSMADRVKPLEEMLRFNRMSDVP